jgi:pimeloyl-ACP methyl ester carboxylesterase
LLLSEVIDPGPGLPPVEALRLPAIDPSSEQHVLILPGNPGAGRFYEPFMTRLHALLQGQAEILTLSYPGHESQPLSNRFLTLQETITLVKHVLTRYRDSDTVVVVGHSIGCYIALQALRDSYPCPQFVQILALFPFLQFDESNRHQRILRRLASNLTLVRLLLAACRALPAALLHRLATRKYAHAYAIRALLELFRDRPVTATFTLARHEFADLMPPLQNVLPLGDFADRLWVFAVENDTWFPTSHRTTVETLLAPGRVTLLPDVAHAFAASLEHSHQVAEAVVKHCAIGRAS